MADLVRHLKRNVLDIRHTLQKDEAVREIVESSLDKQMPKVLQETERLKKHLKSASKSTLVSYMIILMVCVVFFATYLLIKIFPAPR